VYPSRFLLVSGVAAAFAFPTSVSAQSWVNFTDETPSRLSASTGLGSGDPQEKDYAWADLDKDGDIDLICVRKEPFTSDGRFPNVLFMNENGVLTDRTSALASASTVAGSQGFLDSTNDRDAVIVDVNGDTWLDVVTCTTLSETQPQYIRTPRVYINRGNNGQGVWQGFLFDDEQRIDDTALGWQGVERFCSISAGDIDGDGDQDIYFGDYQQGGTRSLDVNDRLLINDGTGYFSDQSSARMTVEMLESSFAMSTAIVDMNNDGRLDILKDDALNAPQGISISYNDSAAGVGYFGSYDVAYGFQPYHFAVGDLNNDNLPDVIVSDDGADRYMLHAGVVGGLATFNPARTFSFTGGGGDDGFGGNNLIVDLNNDGWNDAIIADIDVDIAGYNRRCHIYRNLGDAPNVTLQEETVGGAVVGIPLAQLQGTHDVAVFDIDGDGWKDMVMGRYNGTTVWMNDPPSGLILSYPSGLVAQVAPGRIVTLDVSVAGIGGVTPAAGTGLLYYSVNGGPFSSLPMRDEGPGLFSIKLPRLTSCADELSYYVTVDSSASTTYSDPPTAPSSTYVAIATTGTSVIFEDNFEGAATGWTVQSTSLTSGAWEVAVPIGTTNGAEFAAPSDDAEAAGGTRCYVTQNGVVGGSAGAADVDGGPTDLISPPFDLDGTDGYVTYARWFYSSGADTLVVSVSPDGSNWTTVETVGGGNNQWTVNTFRVGDYITPSAANRVRFRTSDNPNDSITEAAIDLFGVSAFLCECAPLCQADIGLMGPGTATFSGLVDDPPGPLPPTMGFLVEGAPAGAPGMILWSLGLAPTPAFGGMLIHYDPFLIGPFVADPQGTFGVYVPGNPGSLLVYAQGVYLDSSLLPHGVGITNGLEIESP